MQSIYVISIRIEKYQSREVKFLRLLVNRGKTLQSGQNC
jgi:hypothetical protein